jgi:hypothetical protein
MVKYEITVTGTQLQVLSQACELLARIQGGQIREAFNHLPLKPCSELNWEAYHDIQDELTRRMPEILLEGIDGWRSSFGVGSKKLPESHDIAWDLHCSFRYHDSWQRAIRDGIVESMDSPRVRDKMLGVNYDKPLGWGTEPLPEVRALEITTSDKDKKPNMQ